MILKKNPNAFVFQVLNDSDFCLRTDNLFSCISVHVACILFFKNYTEDILNGNKCQRDDQSDDQVSVYSKTSGFQFLMEKKKIYIYMYPGTC